MADEKELRNAADNEEVEDWFYELSEFSDYEYIKSIGGPDLSPEQEEIYNNIPLFHRQYLESFIDDIGLFWITKFTKKVSLHLITTTDRDEHVKKARRLFQQYQRQVQDVSEFMELGEVMGLIYPLNRFDNLSGPFISSIIKLIKQRVISTPSVNPDKLEIDWTATDEELEERSKICDQFREWELYVKVNINDLEKVAAEYLSPRVVACLVIWRNYIEMKKQRYRSLNEGGSRQPRPSTRLDLQIELISTVKAENPKFTIKEIYSECGKRQPKLFNMALISFIKNTMKSWRERTGNNKEE